MTREPIQIMVATFSDGIMYSLILKPEGVFETLIDNSILTEHENLEDALKFLSDWSEEIINKSLVDN